MTDRLVDIEAHLVSVKETLQVLNDKIDFLSNKIDTKVTMEEEVLEECKKMGAHIDFIETVYNNVKHPLGFICNKIKYLTGDRNVTYTLTDTSNNSNIDTKLKLENKND